MKALTNLPWTQLTYPGAQVHMLSNIHRKLHGPTLLCFSYARHILYRLRTIDWTEDKGKSVSPLSKVVLAYLV